MSDRATWSDVRDALRRAIAAGATLSGATDGGLDVDSREPLPASVARALATPSRAIADALALYASPLHVAQLAAYWDLERAMRSSEGRRELEDFIEERAAIREYDGRMDPDAAVLCAIGDLAAYLLAQTWRTREHGREDSPQPAYAIAIGTCDLDGPHDSAAPLWFGGDLWRIATA